MTDPAERITQLESDLADARLDAEGWKNSYEAMRSVARHLRDHWTPETDEDPPVWYLEPGIDDGGAWDGTKPMTPDERRALDELEADRG